MPDLDPQEYEALERAELLGNGGAIWRAARNYYRAALAAREEPQPTPREQKLEDALADALLWLERIPPPEEEVRALGRGLWDETLENARVLLAAREDSNPTGGACGERAGHLTGRCRRGLGHPGDHNDDEGHEWSAAREDTERPDDASLIEMLREEDRPLTHKAADALEGLAEQETKP